MHDLLFMQAGDAVGDHPAQLHAYAHGQMHEPGDTDRLSGHPLHCDVISGAVPEKFLHADYVSV